MMRPGSLQVETTVGEAAYQVGYSSQSQFGRDFRRYFGRSPRQWANAVGSLGRNVLAVESK